MGFGSYDESEQENNRIDTDELGESDERATTTHDGEIHFEYDDASSEDLLETYQEHHDT